MARHDYDLPEDYEKRVEEGTMCEWYTQERNKRQMMRQKLPHTRRVKSALDRIKRKTHARSMEKKIEKMKEAATVTYEDGKMSMKDAVDSLLDHNDVDHEYDVESLKPKREEETVSKREKMKDYIVGLIP